MITIARQLPLLYPDGRFDHPRSHAGQQVVPIVNCGNLSIRGDFRVETNRGMIHTSEIGLGDRIIFIPEKVTATGKGLPIISGDCGRQMSPSEMWALGASWFTPPSVKLWMLKELTELTPEYDKLVYCDGTFVTLGTGKFYKEGICNLDTFQLRGFLRGCLYAVSTWNSLIPKLNAPERHMLVQKLTSAVGRFIAHMGILLDKDMKLHEKTLSNTASRFDQGQLHVPIYDFLELEVTEVREAKIKTGQIEDGLMARVPGINVEGLLYRPNL